MWVEQASRMKLWNTAHTLGIGTATAADLSLLKVNKDLVVGFTAVVVGAGLMISLKVKNDKNLEARNSEYFLIEHKINLNLQNIKRRYSITTKP